MLLELVTIILFFIILYLFFKNREWKIRFDQKIKEWKEQEEERIRSDAIARSARTLSGKTLERFVPFLEDFPYDPHDARWIGDPIDFIIFDGYSSNKERNGEIKQIVFCEIKSGESTLSKIQKRIKDIVLKKKVKWEDFRVE